MRLCAHCTAYMTAVKLSRFQGACAQQSSAAGLQPNCPGCQVWARLKLVTACASEQRLLHCRVNM